MGTIAPLPADRVAGFIPGVRYEFTPAQHLLALEIALEIKSSDGKPKARTFLEGLCKSYDRKKKIGVFVGHSIEDGEEKEFMFRVKYGTGGSVATEK